MISSESSLFPFTIVRAVIHPPFSISKAAFSLFLMKPSTKVGYRHIKVECEPPLAKPMTSDIEGEIGFKEE
jgi:hypothetical protein